MGGTFIHGRPFLLLTSDHPYVSVVGENNLTATEGEEVTLTCQVTSTPEPVVTWMLDGTNVMVTSSDDHYVIKNIDSNYLFIIKNATPANSGNYTCQVNNTVIPEVVVQWIFLRVTGEHDSIVQLRKFVFPYPIYTDVKMTCYYTLFLIALPFLTLSGYH